MASALLTNATSDGRGAAVGASGPSTIQVTGDSVLSGQAYIKIMYSFDDIAAEYSTVGEILTTSGGFPVDVSGDYFVIAELVDSQSDTDVTVKINQ
jgi:hypothetical protein